MIPSTSSDSCHEQFCKISIAASAREAIVRGDRQGALRLLNSLVLAGAQRAADLTPETDDAPQSRLLIQMQGVIAEYERAKILERHRRGTLFSRSSATRY